MALVTGGAVALVWCLVRANDVGWSSRQTVGTLVAGSALLLAFVWWERRARAPMVPLGLFRSQAFAVGNAATFLMSGATFAAAFLITHEFQFARGYSPIGTGLRLLPFFATPMIISPFAGAVFAIAIGSAVFAAHGHLGDPATVTAGFRPALWSSVGFAVLAAALAVAIPAAAPQPAGDTEPADVLVAA